MGSSQTILCVMSRVYSGGHLSRTALLGHSARAWHACCVARQAEVSAEGLRVVVSVDSRRVLPGPLATRLIREVRSAEEAFVQERFGGHWLREWSISCEAFEGVPRTRLASAYLDWMNPYAFVEHLEGDFAVSVRRPLHSALVEAHMDLTGDHNTTISSHAWDICHYLTRCS